MSAPAEPVRVELTMAVEPGRDAEFVAAWQQAAAWMRHQPGCLRQTLARVGDADEPAYLVSSDWSSAAAFHAVERSAEQDRITAPLRGLRRSARMRLHAVVHHLESDNTPEQQKEQQS